MVEIDLDAMRAARQEAAGKGHLLRFGGQQFDLPATLPLAASVAFRAEDDMAFLVAMLGTEALERFMALGPSVPDVEDFAGAVLTLYAVSPEKSEASPASSKSNGTRPRRTSSAATG